MILDGHVHVGRWREPSFSGRETDLDDAVRVMAESGVHGALVMPTDEGDNEGLLAAVGEYRGQVALRLCAWVDPGRPANLAWMEAHVTDLAALKIHPSFLRLRPTDPALWPWFRLAAKHGLPVLVHCGRWQEMSSWRFGLELAVGHPDVNLILCHMGGDGTDLIEAVVAALSAKGAPTNVWLGTESIRQYWSVQRAAHRLGAGRLIFGSDYNLNHPRSFLAVVYALALSAEDRAAVLGGNLQRLLPASQKF